MMRLNRMWIILVLLSGTLIASCGDDDPSQPVDLGSSKVTLLNANPDVPEIVFFRGGATDAIASPINYGAIGSATVPNGNISFSAKTPSGTQLASGSGTLDSNGIELVIFGGTLTSPDLVVTSQDTIAVNAGEVAVRFVNASKDAGLRSLLLNDSSAGLPVASSIAYRATSNYVKVPLASATSLYVTDPATGKPAVQVPFDSLSGSRRWTVVLVGSPNASNANARLKGLLIAE